ncbi:uncharacterized protein SPAPADRAFT_59599 [Spathaspora passalidarum NRRL Y-27907]|uniref:Uncharacterized protein n=1 Tax=Spathaspora passalidarum (strain NRRL Y-27907 / 11-Y1) TaxID=619300 RepID=G3AHK3_SPAPN|nr:uncharacterized protein SPAPADRAFT_59599 [Spathaspora passalidarum NRRL Y-27907]EGW34167.1 hypothetical protein SPAPADRAFT_59599 [Spathaspora passalidarum NRRL Y-27907]
MSQSTQFLTLSTEVSEPFIIENVSPVSSPNLKAHKSKWAKPTMGTDKLTPVAAFEDDQYDDELIAAKDLPTINLN